MSVCTTCREPGIGDYGQHQCPGYGKIRLSRRLGHGIVVETAPGRARMSLFVLAERGWGACMQDPDLINIADQVLYQVIGYDPESASLILEPVEDWRPVPQRPLSEADYEACKARRRETYGKPGSAHPVELPNTEER